MVSDEIEKKYKEHESIKYISKTTGCSWNRVVKILSSKEYILNETHEMILNLVAKGLAQEEIANQLSMNIKTVKAYLPYARGCIYKENLSKNALAIQKIRQRHNN